MSDADEKKPEDLSFDFNSSAPTEDANDSFDFNMFADEAAATPTAEQTAEQNDTTEAMETFGALGEPLSATESAPESEFGAAPSGFLSGDAEEQPSTEVAAPVVDSKKKKGKEKPEKKKKEKKEKPAKEKGPREPMDLGAVLSLCFGILALLGLIGINALIFTAPATPGIGGSSTIYYAVGVNVFGLVFVAVPFLFWKFSKGKEKEQNLQMFDVLLGIALMALAVGIVCFLTAFYRYDFTIKAAKPTATVAVQSVA